MADMRVFVTSLFVLALTAASATGGDGGLVVYDAVPGAEASDQYALAVRPVASKAPWRRAFAFITRAEKGISGRNAYFPRLSGWSNTYINFEMNRPVEVEIRRVNGEPIRKAVVRPQRKVRSLTVRNGRAYVTIEEPCLIAVDIDGQMDDQDTGIGYRGPPIHTVTIFANPFIEDRPAIDDPDVHTVAPADEVPSEGPWKTLYFLPGVHDIALAFPCAPIGATTFPVTRSSMER